MTAGAGLAACGATAQAGEAVDGEIGPSRYVLGVSVRSAPAYDGADQRVFKVRPLWAYKYGRFRISTSGASSVMGFGGDPIGSGVSAELLRSDRWKLGAALRFDSGRQSGDSTRLAGLPDIESALRGRFFVSYRIDDRWGVSGSLSQDLMGRKGGAEVGLNLNYRRWIGAQTMLSAGAGVSLADRQNMQTYFGITNSQAAKTGLSSFNPGAGLKDFHAGVGVMSVVTPRWVVFANLGASTLLGDAASSPLTQQRTTTQATVGLAYRCCD